MTTMVEERCHPIFTQDPAHWMQYIYKKVRVLTGPNQEHVGHVYTVDPVTSSFILVHFPPATASDAAASTAANVTGTSSNSATTPNTTTASDTTAATVTEVKASDISATTSPASTPKTSVGVCVIPGHAVVDVAVLQEDDNDAGNSGNGPKDSDYEKIKARLDALFLNSKNSQLGFGDSGNMGIETSHLSEEALSERKDKLKSWMLKNRLPVQEQKGQDGDKPKCLCVAGAVTILPPYGPGNCCSTNEIILSRIQNLIRNMPPTV
ncbi:gem-associated protein 6 [Octopus sinensis]|uniref:Gem-associated protein 6 n=1 Tax=Octopus sinensis TaxID=2607531 RepID=A0A6P7T6K5_9MOLL|nr:gem-associated protein 6 [Octopus sinensis]